MALAGEPKRSQLPESSSCRPRGECAAGQSRLYARGGARGRLCGGRGYATGGGAARATLPRTSYSSAGVVRRRAALLPAVRPRITTPRAVLTLPRCIAHANAARVVGRDRGRARRSRGRNAVRRRRPASVLVPHAAAHGPASSRQTAGALRPRPCGCGNGRGGDERAVPAAHDQPYRHPRRGRSRHLLERWGSAGRVPARGFVEHDPRDVRHGGGGHQSRRRAGVHGGEFHGVRLWQGRQSRRRRRPRLDHPQRPRRVRTG